MAILKSSFGNGNLQEKERELGRAAAAALEASEAAEAQHEAQLAQLARERLDLDQRSAQLSKV